MSNGCWQLYRNLILGGLALVVFSFVVIHFVQSNYLFSRSSSLKCSDVELSALNIMLGESVSASHHQWITNNIEPPLTIEQSLNVLKNNVVSVSQLVDDEVAFYHDGGVLFSGIFSDSTAFYSIELLLRQFLESSLYNMDEKKQLLDSLVCINVDYIENPRNVMEGLQSMHSSSGSDFFVWSQKNHPQLAIGIPCYTGWSLTFLVTGVVAITILLMLLLIWKEFLGLEIKRKTFEKFTKQIARGEVSLPENISDSDGTLEELADSFDSMSSHIQRLLKVQREMINAISHELRTPIARLRFGLESLKDDVSDDVSVIIDWLEGDVEELNTLVDEVLTYGKLEEGALALHFTKVDMAHVMSSIVENNEALLSGVDIQIEIDLETSIVLADSHHLPRALQNLILNASKYAKSSVKVSFFSCPESWRVDIEDDGPGIAIEDRDKVFIPFQRLDNSRTRASGGYGLGLAIVQKIAFWHGGAVLIDDSPLGGAKFSFIWSRNYHKKDVS
ncbi:ATP-binding protein [Marinomonas sp. 2405UD68-3]|uniref:ATP-binding protein n=1 Tax=Marinomonas sp. 2405UD68-3 TaxID=3391835 RepID=UPI0039C8D10C